ncbi:hypothetical protein QFZ42_002791 [Variovorax paradoxus]|uniref:hypothetical protein n=1 Tax=Variovorax paradoxus TaxID=34073 RepID=UPI00278EC868|nr:hypothetical protein [Variovorax paradoxus]MDQ0570957.1 hypothetical protein [Variovorax paradoxus]
MTALQTPARRVWHVVSPTGEEHQVILEVGIPAPRPDGSWGVMTSVGGLDPEPRIIFGVDAWQAMSLGMHFVANQVEFFSEKGWQFFWERAGDRASASELRCDSPEKEGTGTKNEQS